MRWSRLWQTTGAAVLAGAVLTACGCGLTATVAQAGLGNEKLVAADAPAGPVTGAFADADGRRLMVRYRVEFEGEAASCWLCVSEKDLARRTKDRAVFKRGDGRCVMEVADDFRERLVSSRPRWSTADMVAIELVAVDSPEDLPEGGFLGVQKLAGAGQEAPGGAGGRADAYRVCWRIDSAATPEPDVLVILLPERRRRSAGGRALQLLLPVAVTLDVAGVVCAACPELVELAVEAWLRGR